MIESQFIRENQKVWHELEMSIHHGDTDPDKMGQLFRKVSGDLSYAQTHFPRRRVNVYLNGLVAMMFDKMQTKPKYQFLASIKRFYTDILPNEVVRSCKPMLVSFILFMTCIIIGAVTTFKNEDFAREILGERYVIITNENIAKGDPMAIYKAEGQLNMFLGITLNNVMVALRCFVMGIFAGVGTIFMLIYNGVMVGVFQAMFYHKGLLLTSFLTIWIHGTIEISAIILAGGAGLILGNALLFPNTLTRIQSLKLGASRAVTIILSTIPLFIIAGFVEGFITRLTDLPSFVKILIIGLSAGLILLLYVIMPYRYYKGGRYGSMKYLQMSSLFYEDTFNAKDSVFRMTFKTYGYYFGAWIKHFFAPILLTLAVIFYLIIHSVALSDQLYNEYHYIGGGFPMAVFWVVIFTYFFCIMHLMIKRCTIQYQSIIQFLQQYLLAYLISAIIWVLPFYLLPYTYFVFLYLAMPFCLVFFINHYLEEDVTTIQSVKQGFRRGYSFWVSIIVISFIAILLFLLCRMMIKIIYSQFLSSMLSWHLLFENEAKQSLFFEHFSMSVVSFLILPIFYLLLHYRVLAITKLSESWDLVEGIRHFGSSNKKLQFED
jgi:uncharacterized membrane protein SpoIIM required for sporulation